VHPYFMNETLHYYRQIRYLCSIGGRQRSWMNVTTVAFCFPLGGGVASRASFRCGQYPVRRCF
jgi:hypothetical protein